MMHIRRDGDPAVGWCEDIFTVACLQDDLPAGGLDEFLLDVEVHGRFLVEEEGAFVQVEGCFD